MFDYKIISKTEYQNLKYDIEHLIQKNKSLKSEIFEVKNIIEIWIIILLKQKLYFMKNEFYI